jgi:ribonuclease-3 family protein
MYSVLEEVVSEEELAVMKRGRNAKSFTTAKNQSVTDYRRATGVEALFGYVYLKGDSERVMELFRICMSDKNT